jgi:translocation and assembly module TamA
MSAGGARSAAAWLLAGALAAAGAARAQAGEAAAAPLAAAEGPASAPARSVPPAWTLQVEAPAPLKALLEQHLDLARVARLAASSAEAEPLDETELRRLQGAAPAQARELLQTEGYFNAEVSVQREAGPPQRIRLVVRPGERTQVAGFTLLTAGELDLALQSGDAAARALLAELQANWPLRQGVPFRNAEWNAAKSALLGRLRAAGYAAAAYDGTLADVDAPGARVKLLLVLNSGPLFRAGEVQVRGLERQRDTSARKLAGFGPGTPLTETLLLDYQERLQKTGLYDSVTVSFAPDPAQAAAAPVLVQLRELPLQQATLGVGYSDDTGARVSLEHTHRQVFGWDATAHNKIELGRDKRLWEWEISSHPGDNFYRNLVGGQLQRLKSDTDLVYSRRIRLGRTRDTRTIERTYFVEAEADTQSFLDGLTPQKKAQAVSANYHLILRRLDSVLLPTRGWTLSLQGALGQAHGDSGSGAFTRLYGRATGYWPLGRSWYGQARLELGQLFRRSGLDVPDSLEFRAGGDDSVRGYPYRSLAPTVDGSISGGSVLMTASAEVARPISAAMPSLWGAVFIDAGRAAEGWRGFKPALGYGVGLRWRSPVGPLKLDWAWGEELKRGRLHLSVGIAF